MAIDIQRIYRTSVILHFYGENENYAFTTDDDGTIDEIAERVCEILVHHNFFHATVISKENGKTIMNITRG